MKKNYLKITLILLSLSLGISLNAQTVLQEGDIMFVGYDSVGTDRCAFITLVDLAENTTFSWTNIGWTGSAFRSTVSTDEVKTWSTGSNTYPAGTIFEYEANNIRGRMRTYSGSGLAVAGTSVTDNFGGKFSMNGQETLYVWQNDGVYAMPSTDSNGSWGRWICAMTTTNGGFSTSGINNNSGRLPGALSLGASAVNLDPTGNTAPKGAVYVGFIEGSDIDAGLPAFLGDSSQWEIEVPDTGVVNGWSFWEYSNSGSIGIANPSLSINDSLELGSFASVYPNPVKDILNVSLKNNANLSKLELFSMTGRLVKYTNTNTLNMNDLSSGLYLLNIVSDAGTITKKITKL